MLRASLRSASRWWILVAAVLLLIGALRTAAVVILPIVLGLVLAMLLAPLVRRLDRIMWRWVACLLALVVPVAFVALTSLFWWYAGGRVMERAGSFSLERAVERLSEAREWIVDRGVPEGWIPGPAEEAGDADGADSGGPRSAAGGEGGSEPAGSAGDASGSGDATAMLGDRAIAAATGGLRTLFNSAVAIGFALALCYFALWEAPRWRRWVASWPGRARAEYALSVATQSSRVVQRYLLAKTISGAIAGSATWLWLLALDVPLALVWGGLAFLMNFIPSVGVLLSAIPPIILATVELGVGPAMLVAAGLVAIEALTGQVIEPLLQADLLDLSPFVVLASVLFWGWMWGAPGAVLAPILTAAALIAVQQLQVRPH